MALEPVESRTRRDRRRPLPRRRRQGRAVRAMFDRIAPALRPLNRLLTFGLDRGWRRAAIDARRRRAPAIACSISPAAPAIWRRSRRPRGARVVGVDFARGDAARRARAVLAAAAGARRRGARCRCRDACVDAVTCGFALRNFVDRCRRCSRSARACCAGRPPRAARGRPARRARSLRAGHALYFRPRRAPARRAARRSRGLRVPARSRRPICRPRADAAPRMLEAAGFAEVGSAVAARRRGAAGDGAAAREARSAMASVVDARDRRVRRRPARARPRRHGARALLLVERVARERDAGRAARARESRGAQRVAVRERARDARPPLPRAMIAATLGRRERRLRCSSAASRFERRSASARRGAGFPPARVVLPRALVRSAMERHARGVDRIAAHATRRRRTRDAARAAARERGRRCDARRGRREQHARGLIARSDRSPGRPRGRAHARDAIAAGALEKLVLARTAPCAAASAFDPARCSRALRRAFPPATIFAVGRGRRDASSARRPSAWCGVRGDVAVEPPPSPARRRAVADPDGRPALARARCSRARRSAREHAIVVARRARGARAARATSSTSRPRRTCCAVRRRPASRDADRGRLCAGRATCSSSRRALHPTPAVCGAPRDAALAWLARARGLDRGWYAGAVGWIDAGGDGELAVALRSALLAAATRTSRPARASSPARRRRRARRDPAQDARRCLAAARWSSDAWRDARNALRDR